MKKIQELNADEIAELKENLLNSQNGEDRAIEKINAKHYSPEDDGDDELTTKGKVCERLSYKESKKIFWGQVLSKKCGKS